ncbi:MAG: acylglycerol kinase family protein, partial [Pyrinomonadaceae bacterium]
MSGGAETLVIVNHSAARARAAWTEVRAALAAAGVVFDAHEAREFGDARESAREAVAAGYRTVAVVGGDGTLSEVVNGFFARETERRGRETESTRAPTTPASARAALAVLPAGTGNDFARA